MPRPSHLLPTCSIRLIWRRIRDFDGEEGGVGGGFYGQVMLLFDQGEVAFLHAGARQRQLAVECEYSCHVIRL